MRVKADSTRCTGTFLTGFDYVTVNSDLGLSRLLNDHSLGTVTITPETVKNDPEAGNRG